MLKHLPNFLTASNLFTGSIGIVFAFSQDYTNTIIFVAVAAFFDFLDGFAARLFGATGEMGKQLDSLADLVSFGVLPSMYMYIILQNEYNNEILPFTSLLITVFSAARLAKFNIDDSQSDKFRGLPTPANAVMVTTVAQLPESITAIPHFYLFFTLVSAFLLIAPIDLLALKFKNWTFKDNIFKYSLVIISVLLLLTLQIRALPYLVPAYIIVSLISLTASRGNK